MSFAVKSRLCGRSDWRLAKRTVYQKALDFLAVPVRGMALHGARDRWGLSSLANERFDAASDHVVGRCLDVGCGRHNRFVREYLGGNGRGIDVYPYEGLAPEELVEDMRRFPFEDSTFDSVSFIANLNHVPESLRDVELGEAHRVLRPGGNIIVTMGNPVAEVAAHKLVSLYDRLLGTTFDVDSERQMAYGEAYYLKDDEIVGRLHRAGFLSARKHFFWTQWFLNHLFVAWKSAV